MLGVIRHDTQNVYINNRHIEGAIGHAASVSIQKDPISIAGYGYAGRTPTSTPDIQFDVERNIVTSDDPITGFFDGYVNATYKYGTRENAPTQKFFSIESGILTSYNLSVSVNNIATSNFSIRGLGKADTTRGGDGENFNPSPSTPSYSVTVAKSRDLILDVKGWRTNRVQSVDYGLSIEYNTKRYVGHKNYDFFNEIIYPIELRCTFELEVDDYEIGEVMSLLCDPQGQTLDFVFYDCLNDDLRRFNAPSAELVDYSHNGSTDGRMTATLSYVSHINDVASLAETLSTSNIGSPAVPLSLSIGTMEVDDTFEVGL